MQIKNSFSVLALVVGLVSGCGAPQGDNNSAPAPMNPVPNQGQPNQQPNTNGLPNPYPFTPNYPQYPNTPMNPVGPIQNPISVPYMGGSGYGNPPGPAGGPGYGNPPGPVGGPGYGNPPGPAGGPGYGNPPGPAGGPGYGNPPGPAGGPGYGNPPGPVGGPGQGQYPMGPVPPMPQPLPGMPQSPGYPMDPNYGYLPPQGQNPGFPQYQNYFNRLQSPYMQQPIFQQPQMANQWAQRCYQGRFDMRRYNEAFYYFSSMQFTRSTSYYPLFNGQTVVQITTAVFESYGSFDVRTFESYYRRCLGQGLVGYHAVQQAFYSMNIRVDIQRYVTY